MRTVCLPDGMVVGLTGSPSEREGLLNLFRAVALEQGWRPADDLEGDAETAICVAATCDGRLAGGVALRQSDGQRRLPIHGTWPELAGLPLPEPAELVLIALAPDHRATPGLLWALCAEAWRACARRGVTDLLAAVPPRNLPLYRRLGWCPETVGPEREHWGEPCLPCRIGIAGVAEEFARRAARSPDHALAVRVAHRD